MVTLFIVTLDVVVSTQPIPRDPVPLRYHILTHGTVTMPMVVVVMHMTMVMMIILKRLPEFLPSNSVSRCCSQQ